MSGGGPPSEDGGVTERVYESSSVEETERAAADLAATLAGGEVVALDGDLGAGKTQFVRGLVRGLGGDPRRVSSPTFVLLHVYGRPAGDNAGAGNDGAGGGPPADAMRLPVFHLDAYRVGGADDFEAIGFAELLEQGGVVVVEWPGRVADLLPAGRIEVAIRATGETTRTIVICRPDMAFGQKPPAVDRK